jgi:hypothetical protein
MRYLILIILFSTSVYATEYCKNFNFTSGKLSCLEVASENFIDDKAGFFCTEQINFDREKSRCLALSIDKKYRRSTLEVCKTLSNNADKLKCIKNSGKSFKEGNVLREVYFLAEESIWAIEDQNLSEALGLVTDLKDLVREALDDQIER